MRITSLNLKNFKRFTDLSIKEIPETAKLVLIVGPNGSGKSSLFDALLHWYRQKAGWGIDGDESYYRKNHEYQYSWQDSVNVTYSGRHPTKGDVHIRSAYRNEADFNVSNFDRPQAPTEKLGLSKVIHNDSTVSENYKNLILDTISGLYDLENDQKSVRDMREELIGNIRSSMKNVFEDLTLNSISDPLKNGSFRFGKGSVSSYHYKNLSGGEKAAFDLILDVHIRKKFFNESIYCIDEIETHLHTRIQGLILKEIYKVVSKNSQLWITTHSLGVLRAAQELDQENPGSVCIIDFDVTDPDIPREIFPSSLNRITWEKMLSIALDDLSSRVAPRVIVICEGSFTGNRRKDFDSEIYNRILSRQTPDVIFVSGGSSSQVAVHGVSVRQTLEKVLPSTKIFSLCDRDEKSDQEVLDFEALNGIVLPFRNLESFLFEDEVIIALVKKSITPNLIAEALKVKVDAIQESIGRGNPPNDLKSAAGKIFTELKRLLNLQKCGNSTEAFMRDTLAPLVEPNMEIYKALKTSIIDRVLLNIV